MILKFPIEYFYYHLGSKYTEPDYKNLKVKPTPFLYMYHYILNSVEFITDKSIEIFLIVQNQTHKNKHNMFYILTEEGYETFQLCF